MKLPEHFLVKETPIAGSFDKKFEITCLLSGVAETYYARDAETALLAARDDTWFARLDVVCERILRTGK